MVLIVPYPIKQESTDESLWNITPDLHPHLSNSLFGRSKSYVKKELHNVV